MAISDQEFSEMEADILGIVARMERSRATKNFAASIYSFMTENKERIRRFEESQQNALKLAEETRTLIKDSTEWKARALASEQMSFVYRETINSLQKIIVDLWIKTQK